MLTKFLTGIAVAAAMAAAFLLGRHGGSDELSRRLTVIENNQRALQDAYLNDSATSRRQLAQRLGYRAMPVPQAQAAGAASGKAAPSPEQGREMAAKIDSSLQDAFEAEPINAAWAGTVQQNVQDLLDGVTKSGGVTAPRSASVDCRTKTCRIDLAFADGSNPDALMESLTTEISGDLPNTTVVQLPSPDGRGTVVHVFANTGKP